MVLPSPSRSYAEKIKEATRKKVDLWIKGYTIGGGPITSAIKNHIFNGNNVYMTSSAAYSLRNNVEEVKRIGVEVINNYEGKDVEEIFFDEVHLNKYDAFLKYFSETVKNVDLVAISVKDHGVPTVGLSNREFRIRKFKELLEKDSNLNSFLMCEKDVPDFFIRMKSSIKASKHFLPNVNVCVMDTSPSAVYGCLEDPRVKSSNTVLAVNVGNGHTMAAVVRHEKMLGFFEHHTGRLSCKKLEFLLKKLVNGELTHEEVFDDGGHGAVLLEQMPGLPEIDIIAVTGPMRSLLDESSLKFIQASPGGDVMMTGTIGILKAYVNH
jgi:uncharacterized protein (DUF1786 family)